MLVNSNYHEKYPCWNKHNHCSSTCVELKLWGSTKEKKQWLKLLKAFSFLELKKAASLLYLQTPKKVIKAIYQALGTMNSAISCKESGLLFVLAEMDQR